MPPLEPHSEPDMTNLKDVGDVAPLILDLKQDLEKFSSGTRDRLASDARELESKQVLPAVPGFESFQSRRNGSDSFVLNGKDYRVVRGEAGEVKSIVGPDDRKLVDGDHVKDLQYDSETGTITFKKCDAKITIDTATGKTIFERGNQRITRDANNNRIYEERQGDSFHSVGFRTADGIRCHFGPQSSGDESTIVASWSPTGAGIRVQATDGAGKQTYVAEFGPEASLV